ncbi:hypothetical protein ABES36_29255, partial [Bacillus pseudomycoides]|uniref:hypothetical protein n=1 Tax=Bacillus pseudomycoides TaxID=64104 RepID=UPI003D1C6052
TLWGHFRESDFLYSLIQLNRPIAEQSLKCTHLVFVTKLVPFGTKNRILMIRILQQETTNI